MQDTITEQISVVTASNLAEKLREVANVFYGKKRLIYRWVFESDFEKARVLFQDSQSDKPIQDDDGNSIMSARHEYGIHSISHLDEEGKTHESIIFVNVRGNKSVIKIGDSFVIVDEVAVYINRCTESGRRYWEVWSN